jgi:hypothetical protein
MVDGLLVGFQTWFLSAVYVPVCFNQENASLLKNYHSAIYRFNSIKKVTGFDTLVYNFVEG